MARNLHLISEERRRIDPYYAKLCDRAEREQQGSSGASLDDLVQAKRASYNSTQLLLKTRGFLAAHQIAENLRSYLRAIAFARTEQIYSTSLGAEFLARARLLGAEKALKEFRA